MQVSEGFNVESGTRSERVFRRAPKSSLHFAPIEDNLEAHSEEELLELIAEMTAKKIKDDYEADKRGVAKVRLSKCAREYLIAKYGVAQQAERERCRMALALRLHASNEDAPMCK